ncbi:MAG: AMP-binding protein, partial [Caulobacteraceae bacterium]
MSAGDQDRLHQGATLGHLFARAAARFAERDALVAGDLRLTYARLADRVGAMAAVMRRAGVPQGAAIAILSHNRPDVLVAYLAAVVEGWRLTPLAAMSSVEDQVFILNDAAIDVLVIDAALADRVAPLRGGAPR